MQPALDRGVAFLQCTQAGAHHLAGRGVGAGFYQGVDVAGLGGRQADGAFLDPGHDGPSIGWSAACGYEGFIPHIGGRGEEDRVCGNPARAGERLYHRRRVCHRWRGDEEDDLPEVMGVPAFIPGVGHSPFLAGRSDQVRSYTAIPSISAS